MVEQRWDDVYLQSETFDQLTPLVKAVGVGIIPTNGTQIEFINEKIDLRHSPYRWKFRWGEEDRGTIVQCKEIAIYLRFPQPDEEKNSSYFLAFVPIRIRNQWRQFPVATQDTLEKSLAGLIRFILKHPSQYSEFKNSYNQNLGCPAGCGASSDRFLNPARIN